MKDFRLFFTSDLHGYFFPTDYTDSVEKSMGLFKLAPNMKKDGNTLLLDGGDTIQSSPFMLYTNRFHFRPHPIAQVMNRVGYDYVTLGNHDFNMGLDELQAYLEGLDAVCLCANIRDRAGKLPIRPYAVHTLENGLRIGLVGLCTHYVSVWEKKETLEELIIEHPLAAGKRALDALRGQCDVTVCLYHGGYERDLESGKKLTDSEENLACRIADELDFDVLLTGHQHMTVPCVRIGHTVSLQPGARAKCYGRVTGTLDETTGEKRIETALCPPAEKADDALMGMLRPLETRVQEWLDTPKGHLNRALLPEEHLDMALHGSPIADFINLVQKNYTGAQISATSLGNEVKGMGREVSIRDVVSSYVYSNTLLLLEITGAQLKRYLERCAEYFRLEVGHVAISDAFLRPKVEHYNYDFFSGLSYTIDLRNVPGERVTDIQVNGKTAQPDEKYTLCVNNYRATGAGGYDVLKECKVLRDFQADVCDLIIAYVEEHPDIHVDDLHPLSVIY